MLKKKIIVQKNQNKEANALYIHIPFCQKICNYCDFPKFLIFNKNIEDDYLKNLLKEIFFYKKKKYETIYIGGGTPTILKEKNLELLLKNLNKMLKKNGEFSVETNVDSLTKNKINILKRYGINRVSIGVQSLNQKHLKYLGRTHDIKSVVKLISLLRTNGIKNINCDFLYGYKGFDVREIDHILDFIDKNKITHVSLYPLSILPHTTLFNNHEKELSQEEVRDQYDYFVNKITKIKFHQYEVSNFARNVSSECKHNLAYWNNDYYLGIGLGAASYLKGMRMQNTKSIIEYNKNPIYSKEYEALKIKDVVTYFLITNLRKCEGFSLSNFEKKFGYSILKRRRKSIEKLIQSGLVEIKNDYIKASKKVIMLLDIILRELI